MYVYSPMSALPRWWCESNWASPLRCSRRRDASPWHSRHPSSPPQLGTIWMSWSAPRAPRCHPEVCRSTTNIWTLSQKIPLVCSHAAVTWHASTLPSRKPAQIILSVMALPYTVGLAHLFLSMSGMLAFCSDEEMIPEGNMRVCNLRHGKPPACLFF